MSHSRWFKVQQNCLCPPCKQPTHVTVSQSFSTPSLHARTYIRMYTLPPSGAAVHWSCITLHYCNVCLCHNLSILPLCDHHKIPKLRYVKISRSHDLAQDCSQSLGQNAAIDLFPYMSVIGTHWMGLHYAYTKQGWRCAHSLRSQWRECTVYTASAIAGIGVYIRVEYDLSNDNATHMGELCSTASQHTNLRLTRFTWEPYLRCLFALNTGPTQPQKDTHLGGVRIFAECPGYSDGWPCLAWHITLQCAIKDMNDTNGRLTIVTSSLSVSLHFNSDYTTNTQMLRLTKEKKRRFALLLIILLVQKYVKYKPVS